MTQSLGKIYPGQCVRTLFGETDTDPHGDDRRTPPGTWGHISSHNHGDHWNVSFPNGAGVVLTEDEMLNAAHYTRARPGTLEQRALALRHGQFECELTMLDEELFGFTEEVAGNPEQILELVAACRRHEEDAGDLLDLIRRALKVFENGAFLASDLTLRNDMARIVDRARHGNVLRSVVNAGCTPSGVAAAAA